MKKETITNLIFILSGLMAIPFTVLMFFMYFELATQQNIIILNKILEEPYIIIPILFGGLIGLVYIPFVINNLFNNRLEN